MVDKDKSDDRVNMLLGRKENPELNRILGKGRKFDEEAVIGKNTGLSKALGKDYEEELIDKTITCPKCGHKFVE